jgi:hypothetical protein
MRVRANRQKLGALALAGGFLTSALVALTGCGEDGQSIREAGKCPAQPLHHYEFSDGGGHWVAHQPSQVPPLVGTNPAFTEDEQAALDQAIRGATAPTGGPRCLTPTGNANTLDSGN